MENRRGKIFSVEFEFPWLRKPGKFNFADVLLVCLSMYLHKQEICIPTYRFPTAFFRMVLIL